MHGVFQQTPAATRLRALRRTKIPEPEGSNLAVHIRRCASAEECDCGLARAIALAFPNEGVSPRESASVASSIYYLLIKSLM